jgi:branched-chain amino acid transport system ATP-binding protein
MFLSIKDTFVKYGTLEVLKGVSMEIEEGKISVLLGANGSGKSTLFKAITGLHRPNSGSIWFQGQRIDRLLPPKILHAGIALVPEGKKLFTTMTVWENLEMGAYSRRDRREIAKDIEAMYEHFPVLGQKCNEKCFKMSGGEQQTLAIARALMSKPKLLLLDEPAQGLAPSLVSELADILTGLNKNGVTLMLIEHNLRLGLSLADRVYVLENGKIAFKAEAADLPAVEYAKKIYLGA